MIKIDLKERYKELKEEEQYLGFKQDIQDSFCKRTEWFKDKTIIYSIKDCCFFNIEDFENLIRDSVPDRIMIYFAMEKLCIEYDFILDAVHDVVVEIITSKLIHKNKKYFHKNDYMLLSEDEKIIKTKYKV